MARAKLEGLIMKETWKEIREFDGKYLISSHGRVKRKRILKPFKNKRGYLSFVFRHNGKYKRRYIHRLVAQEFCLKPDKQNHVNHIDGNSSNNFYKNLEWCNEEYNTRDMYRRSKKDLTKEEKYFKAFEKYFNGELVKDIAKDMNINYKYLMNIIFGQKKPHVRFWSFLVLWQSLSEN
jgi:hypothetical protein